MIIGFPRRLQVLCERVIARENFVNHSQYPRVVAAKNLFVFSRCPSLDPTSVAMYQTTGGSRGDPQLLGALEAIRGLVAGIFR